MHSDRSGNAAGSGYLITAPVPFFAAQIAGIGVSTAWVLIAAGEIETIAAGRRRRVVIVAKLCRAQTRGTTGRCSPQQSREAVDQMGGARGGARGFGKATNTGKTKLQPEARGAARRPRTGRFADGGGAKRSPGFSGS
jgi:hypothetical protein